MPYSRHSSDSDREYVLMPGKSVHGGSEFGGRGRRRDLPIEVNNFLEVPQTRPRAASQGGGVAPAIINIGGAALEEGAGVGRGQRRSRSRSHHRHHHRDGSSSSSSYSSDRSRSRHRD